jgi:hypothetical protein
MVRDEFKQAHEGYRQAHEETVIRIGEMYRMAQDEIMNSLAQMKVLVSQIMASQVPSKPIFQSIPVSVHS